MNLRAQKSVLRGILPVKIERLMREIRDQYLRKYYIEELPFEVFLKNQKFNSISFCITCMNRLFHLKKTLKKNIIDNENYPNVEFILVNYNSQDKLDDWINQNFQKYIDKGILNYYRTCEPKTFHASIAKNLAHTVAQNDIVCNLDGDNFTGKNFAFYINYLFNQYGQKAFFHFTKKPFWGTEGRIAFTKKEFLDLGGYDEQLLPIGHEDHDLIHRAKAKGLSYQNVQIENFLKYLSNTEKEKAENCTDNQINYYELENQNIILSDSNIKAGILKANEINGMKKFQLFKNFSKTPIEI